MSEHGSVHLYLSQRLHELLEALQHELPELSFAVVLDEQSQWSSGAVLELTCSQAHNEQGRSALSLSCSATPQRDADAVDVVVSITRAGAVDHRLELRVASEASPDAVLAPVLDVLSWVFADTVRRSRKSSISDPAVRAWHPAWVRLAVELRGLARATDAHNAYVLDAWSNCWCSAHSHEQSPPEPIVALTQQALARLPKPLTRGGNLERAISSRSGHAYLHSFAGVYVLALRFAGPVGAERVREHVEAALPLIENLTLALPSPDDSGPSAGEGALRR